MFASDRDVLVLEPGVFRDVRWAGQVVIDEATATVPSTQDRVTLLKGGFVDAGVGAGSVALVEGVSVEVVGVVSDTQIEVSLLRARAGDAPIPLVFDGGGLSIVISTFAPQIERVHRQLMIELGIAAPVEGGEGAIDDSRVTNPSAFVLAEALGTLALVYASASALVDPDSVTWAKAALYRERYMAERSRLAAEIDVRGEGVAGTTRRVGAGRLWRA